MTVEDKDPIAPGDNLRPLLEVCNRFVCGCMREAISRASRADSCNSLRPSASLVIDELVLHHAGPFRRRAKGPLARNAGNYLESIPGLGGFIGSLDFQEIHILIERVLRPGRQAALVNVICQTDR